MLYRLIFAVTILAATDGSAFAQRTHMIDVWGARIEVPNEGPGGLFAAAAVSPGDTETLTGAATPGISTVRPLANTAPASLKTSRPRP
ncbi:hypothetical protein DA075_19160 [Methylobacterium currus]|uniref:Uncharacterized protein n=1 Tax=Methylobacterium currus TaxID=2051553 RepID=A0A2R4WMJ5_9HYPH|nr:hypothetical protein [Methylobacterium currus]AWB22763.1 hypothetical protein DA075_19160 [Methylobacterium currus]UHC17644.1 hypothetical protein LRS73_07140 [Methylobacterium currus]